MFILRFIKNVVYVVVIAGVTLYVSSIDYKGKTIQAHVQDAWKSGLISEGFKDIKTWIAELFRVGNKVTKDQLTEQDKAKLEGLLKGELKDNVDKLLDEAKKQSGGK
jgi:hypothetical protein